MSVQEPRGDSRLFILRNPRTHEKQERHLMGKKKLTVMRSELTTRLGEGKEVWGVAVIPDALIIPLTTPDMIAITRAGIMEVGGIDAHHHLIHAVAVLFVVDQDLDHIRHAVEIGYLM